MKLLDMACPHDWNNCPECANVELCIAGLYKPDPNDHDVLMKAAKISEEVMHADAIESAERIMLSWTDWHDHQRQIDLLSEDEKWLNMFGNPAPHINYKETLNGGPSEPGGGSKGRNPKKPVKKMPEYMKILGM